MNDPNQLRHHYTKHAQTLARRKYWQSVAEWLIIAALVIAIGLLLSC